MNAKCRFGDTPLLDCTRSNKFDFMELLLKYGACPYAKDNERWVFSSFHHQQGSEDVWREQQEEAETAEGADEGGGGRKPERLFSLSSPESKKCAGC